MRPICWLALELASLICAVMPSLVWTSDLLNATSGRLDQMQKQTVEMIVPKTLREQDQQIDQKPQQAMQARRTTAEPAPTGGLWDPDVPG